MQGERAKRAGRALALSLLAIGCRPQPEPSQAPADPRLAILDPAYGADPDDRHPDARAPGDSIAVAPMLTADGDVLELGALTDAGPVVIVWIGAGEDALTTAWIGSLSAALPRFEAAGASLVFARPLPPAAALRWAEALRLQTPVIADEPRILGDALGLGEAADALDVAVWIVVGDALRYRKLGGRRPQLDELLAVIEGQAEGWRCCPGACVGSPCTN